MPQNRDRPTQQAPPQGFSYSPEFLDEEAQRTLLSQLESFEYTHDVFRGQQLKRSNISFGWDYVAVGRHLRPAPPFPAFLSSLIERAGPYYPADSRFDMCLVQRYPTGAGIGWHQDAPAFGNVILGISLGAPGRLQFRPNGSTEVSFEQTVAPGALYVMQGAARWEFQHQVPAGTAMRCSLTFREVINTAGN